METVISTQKIDLVASSWSMIVTSGGATNFNGTANSANAIAVNPVGAIESTNLQDALRELDSEINALTDLTILFENKIN